MKKVFAMIALSAFLFSCGGSSTTEETPAAAETQVEAPATAPINDSLAAPAADSAVAPAADSSAAK